MEGALRSIRGPWRLLKVLHPPTHAASAPPCHRPCCAGEVFPTTALDALVSQGNNALIDIRSASEKESGGVPDLADSGVLAHWPA